MYRVKIEFQSNIKGIYIKEEEIATDYQKAKYILNRLINKWFDILCPHIDFDKINFKDNDEINIIRKFNYEKAEALKVLLIKQTLSLNDTIDKIYNIYPNEKNIQERNLLMYIEKIEEQNEK